MVMQGCYTEKELRDIQAGALRYDEMSEQQRIMEERRLADAEKLLTPSTKWAVELYELLERENIGFISEVHHEIGTLIAVKERFPHDNTLQQWCAYHIRCAMCEIEELTEEVKHDRKTARELARL
jgi:hypothetical protein